MRISSIYTISSLIVAIFAHGSHDNAIKQKPEHLTWQNWHMLEEHGLNTYDADSFFRLHDLQAKNSWSRSDILNLYGLLREHVVGDGSGMGEHDHNKEVISDEAKEHVVKSILKLLDADQDGEVSIQEWRDFTHNGGQLPDFGYGQGHHLDFESEYEEHHWKKYHAQNDPDVLIKHKEDIEHELLHHEHEIEESHMDHPELRKITDNFNSNIRLENLAFKYRRPIDK
ncbi:hypothetical protein G9P44_002898 [Scheffersomyces stipitis]|nr:hypothetical protein G9P44_002898 [Scheffersomyces stipitis]